jgi:CBS domain-containing protein
MKVADIMTAAALTDDQDDTLAEASAKMWQQQTGSLLVMDGQRLIGIVTERDVLRSVAQGQDPKATSLREVMTRDPVTVHSDTNLKNCAEIMFQKWFRHLPVVNDDGACVGIISTRDLLRIVSAGMVEPENLQALTGHKLARDMRLERIEPGDLD